MDNASRGDYGCIIDAMNSKKILAVSFVLALLVVGALAMQQMSRRINFVGTVTDKRENTMTVDRLIFPDNDLKKAATVSQDVKIAGSTKFVERALKDKEIVRREYASSTPSSRAGNPISFFAEKSSTISSVAVGSKIAVTARGSLWSSDSLVALEVKILPEAFSVTDSLGMPVALQSKK